MRYLMRGSQSVESISWTVRGCPGYQSDFWFMSRRRCRIQYIVISHPPFYFCFGIIYRVHCHEFAIEKHKGGLGPLCFTLQCCIRIDNRTGVDYCPVIVDCISFCTVYKSPALLHSKNYSGVLKQLYHSLVSEDTIIPA